MRNDYAILAKPGVPPQEKYTITAAAMAKVKTLTVLQNDEGEVVQVVYDGGSAAAAITLADYNGLPIGSVIFDVQVFKTHYKTAAATWKSSAAAT